MTSRLLKRKNRKTDYSNDDLERIFDSWNIPVNDFLIHEPDSRQSPALYSIGKTVDADLGKKWILFLHNFEHEDDFLHDCVQFLKEYHARVFTNLADLENYANEIIGERNKMQ